MKAIRIVVIGIFLMIGHATVIAEDGRPSSVIIICSATSEDIIDILEGESAGGAWLRGENMEGYCYGDIVDRIRTELEKNQFELVVVQASPQLDERAMQAAAMTLYTQLDVHGAPLMSLYPLVQPAYFGASPILAAHMESGLLTYVYGESQKETAANLAIGIILYSVGYCDLALPYFDQAEGSGFYAAEGETITRTTTAISFYKGNCSLMHGDLKSAASLFENASNDSPDTLLFFDLQINLAWTYLQLGEAEKSFDLMDQLVEQSKNRISTNQFLIKVLQYRAQLYALAFDYDSAIADMNTAIELDPTNPKWYVLRGQMVLLTYEWDQVLADYNHALELDPDYADAYFYRGVLFYTQGPRENALEDFEHYLELAPDGQHADQASDYAESIRVELAALNE